MTRDIATTIRHLRILGESIESTLGANLGGAFVTASVFKYIELSAELPDDDVSHADIKAEVTEKCKKFAVRLAQIENSSAGHGTLLPNADVPRWPIPKDQLNMSLDRRMLNRPETNHHDEKENQMGW